MKYLALKADWDGPIDLNGWTLPVAMQGIGGHRTEATPPYALTRMSPTAMPSGTRDATSRPDAHIRSLALSWFFSAAAVAIVAWVRVTRARADQASVAPVLVDDRFELFRQDVDVVGYRVAAVSLAGRTVVFECITV